MLISSLHRYCLQYLPVSLLMSSQKRQAVARGFGASDGPQPVALLCARYTGALLKSSGDEPRAPVVIGAKRETPVKYLRGIRVCSSEKVTWPSLCTNSCSMSNRQEELEVSRCCLKATICLPFLKLHGRNLMTGGQLLCFL